MGKAVPHPHRETGEDNLCVGEERQCALEIERWKGGKVIGVTEKISTSAHISPTIGPMGFGHKIVSWFPLVVQTCPKVSDTS
jgi:hypothetical protein